MQVGSELEGRAEELCEGDRPPLAADPGETHAQVLGGIVGCERVDTQPGMDS
jgi:hypothetical protein